VFHGPVTHSANEKLPDMGVREWIMLAPVMALILLIGVYPKPFLDRIEPSAEKVVGQLQQSSVLPGQVEEAGGP
jgi:NADH-quinone oxidoreductase subunit M